MENADQVRSLFLAALMVGSVMVGILYFDIEQVPSVDQPPVITGDEPGQFEIGAIESISVTISDEDLDELIIGINLNSNEVSDYLIDDEGVISIDISDLEAGSHSLNIIAFDKLNQETRWFTDFTIVFPPEENATISLDSFPTTIDYGDNGELSGNVSHSSISSCNFFWSDTDLEESKLILPFEENGDFSLTLPNMRENVSISMEVSCGINFITIDSSVVDFTVNPAPISGCTDSEANNYDENAEEDDGSCTYDEENPDPVEGCTDSTATNYDDTAEVDDGSCEYEEPSENTTGSPEWWSETLLCDEDQVPVVDDYTTEEQDNHMCDLSFVIEDGNITISTNGLPNHDFESTLGCCASAQSDTYTIPLTPIDDSNCNPSLSSEGCVMAPIRGTIAFTVTGVAIFGPEDGPGGDAVALEEGAYEQEEGEQQVDLGVCHGHAGPGGVYHYHADANCIHWHAEDGETMYDYNLDSQRTLSTHSKIVGFALDGYAIYGYSGWNDEGEVVEMTSSYRLKDGADGSGGIDDYEYIKDLGTLDSCNGIFSETPDWPEGIYHYHTTMLNGEGGIGFPYFINCYAGELPSDNGDEDDPCAGGPPDGDVWGPGIGPPPEGCDAGPPPGGGQGQSSEVLPVISPWFKTPPNSGAIVISLLAMAVVAANGLRESAYPEVSRDPVGTTL